MARTVCPEDVRALELILTAGCNLACGYCYQNDKKFRKMTLDTLHSAVDRLMGSRRREVSILLIGGEPLLDFGLFTEAVEYAKKTKPRGMRIRFVTSTNGTLLDRERIEFLARHRVRTQISFDGIRQAQDVRGRGTFDVLERLLVALRRDHADFLRDRVSIAMTLHSSTIPFLAASTRYFMRRGVSEININPVTTHDPAWTVEAIHGLDREVARMFRVSLNHYQRTGEVPLSLFRKQPGEESRRPERIGMCGVGDGHTLAVDVDGEVHGCATFASSYQVQASFLASRFDSMRMGHVQDGAFAARLARYPEAARVAAIFDDKQDKYSSYGRCGDCRYLADCSVCPVSIGKIPGNDDPRRVPDFVCAWNLVSLKYRERFPAQPDPADLLFGRAPVPLMMRELLIATRKRRAARPSNRA